MNALLGTVLAGGASRRFGADKARARVGGLSLLARALRAVAPVSHRVVVVGRQGGPMPGTIEVLDDLRDDAGPLAGIETALHRAAALGAPGVALLACDLPGVGWEVMAALVRRWRQLPDRVRAAVVLSDGDALQPLCGVYGVELGPALSAHLDATVDGGARSARSWVAGLRATHRVAARELADVSGMGVEHLLLNVNRPEDGERARALPPLTPPVVTVVGWKNAGKTTVAVQLVDGLARRGLRVVALKHGHRFEVDQAGTDSWRLRHEGGAARVVLAGPDDHVVMGDWGPDGEPPMRVLVDRYASDAALVVAEGWKAAPVPSVEVRRAATAPSDPHLCRPDDPGVDRFIAVVEPGSSPSPNAHTTSALHAAARLDPSDPELGARLADLVLRRLLPDFEAS